MHAHDRDLIVWTSEGAVVKRALCFECSDSSCRTSRPLEALDYLAWFKWVALSPERGSVFLDLQSLKFLCVLLRARVHGTSPRDATRPSHRTLLSALRSRHTRQPPAGHPLRQCAHLQSTTNPSTLTHPSLCVRRACLALSQPRRRGDLDHLTGSALQVHAGADGAPRRRLTRAERAARARGAPPVRQAHLGRVGALAPYVLALRVPVRRLRPRHRRQPQGVCPADPGREARPIPTARYRQPRQGSLLPHRRCARRGGATVQGSAMHDVSICCGGGGD